MCQSSRRLIVCHCRSETGHLEGSGFDHGHYNTNHRSKFGADHPAFKRIEFRDGAVQVESFITLVIGGAGLIGGLGILLQPDVGTMTTDRGKQDLKLKFKTNTKIIASVLTLALTYLLLWSTDKITWQGERTVYTVQCVRGSWDGNRCTGAMNADLRFRYRVLPPHKEVVFWVVGHSDPSGKLTNCMIVDGRNWKCPENADSARSITLEMSGGVPVHKLPDQPVQFHAVSKLTWTLLNFGLTFFQTAQ